MIAPAMLLDDGKTLRAICALATDDEPGVEADTIGR
jgi:hypothetical protein